MSSQKGWAALVLTSKRVSSWESKSEVRAFPCTINLGRVLMNLSQWLSCAELHFVGVQPHFICFMFAGICSCCLAWCQCCICKTTLTQRKLEKASDQSWKVFLEEVFVFLDTEITVRLVRWFKLKNSTLVNSSITRLLV